MEGGGWGEQDRVGLAGWQGIARGRTGLSGGRAEVGWR